MSRVIVLVLVTLAGVVAVRLDDNDGVEEETSEGACDSFKTMEVCPTRCSWNWVGAGSIEDGKCELTAASLLVETPANVASLEEEASHAEAEARLATAVAKAKQYELYTAKADIALKSIKREAQDVEASLGESDTSDDKHREAIDSVVQREISEVKAESTHCPGNQSGNHSDSPSQTADDSDKQEHESKADHKHAQAKKVDKSEAEGAPKIDAKIEKIKSEKKTDTASEAKATQKVTPKEHHKKHQKDSKQKQKEEHQAAETKKDEHSEPKKEEHSEAKKEEHSHREHSHQEKGEATEKKKKNKKHSLIEAKEDADEHGSHRTELLTKIQGLKTWLSRHSDE